ncbi:hypothetical protein GCM10010324_30590 [Streptomyces hiroshimensis]|uniref:Uncharacterized protein n=1 Tax=Streptomyces hiroshimensis TaxID=66424 RepID=A0ABQ2YIU0_9ACTN|nr:hypothetical protein GCM10010324_30590 [Streptomyces hiroshimensis]
MAPAGEGVGELDEVLGAHEEGDAQDGPLRALPQQPGERADAGHHAEADAVVEAVQRGLGQLPRGHGARDRQLGGEGGQHVAEEEDAGGAGPAGPALQRGDDEDEDDPVQRVQAAGYPQGAGQQDDERLFDQVRGVGAGLAQELVDGGLVAVVRVDRRGQQDQAVEERERRAEGGGQRPQDPAGRRGSESSPPAPRGFAVGVHHTHSAKPLPRGVRRGTRRSEKRSRSRSLRH